METLPTKSSAISLPTQLAPQLERDLRVMLAKLDPILEFGRTNYSIKSSDAPSPELRRSLEIRRQRIDHWLLPAGPERAAEEYQMMVRVMAHPERDKQGSKEHVAIFVKDLMGLPMFALVTACQAFRTGKVGDGKWMPEPGLIRIEAERHIGALAKERRELDALLNAKIVASVDSPERRQAAVAAARAKIQSMRDAGRQAELSREELRIREARQREAEKHVETAAETEARLKSPVKLSPEILRQFGVVDKQEAAE